MHKIRPFNWAEVSETLGWDQDQDLGGISLGLNTWDQWMGLEEKRPRLLICGLKREEVNHPQGQ